MTTQEQIRYATWMSRVGLLASGAIKQSCVASAKITTEVLRSIGIGARPMAASVIVGTDGWVRRMETGDRPTAETWDDWWEQDRAYSLGIAYDPEPSAGAWHAHMIVLAAGQRYLVDPSLDQLARPQRDLPLEPVVVDMAEEAQINLHEFRRGRIQAVTSWHDDKAQQGFKVVWSCFPSDRSFRELPDWTLFEPRYGVMIRSIAATLKQMHAEGLTGDTLPELPPLPDAHDEPSLRAKVTPPEKLRRIRMTAGQ